MRAPWCCRDTGCTSIDHRAHSLANDRPTEPIELRQEPRATHEHRHDGRANYLSSRGLLHQRVRVSEWVCASVAVVVASGRGHLGCDACCCSLSRLLRSSSCRRLSSWLRCTARRCASARADDGAQQR